MIVSEFMTKDVVSCRAEQTVEEAAKLMSEKGLSVMPIVDEKGKLVGIVTESDFVGKDVEIPHALVSLKRVLGENHHNGDIEAIYTRAKKRTLSEVMTANPVTVSPDSTLNDVVGTMSHKELKRLPVVKDDVLIGIVTRKNLLNAFSLL